MTTKSSRSSRLSPGAYKLHVFLFSRYSTESNRPVQELVQDFSIVP